MPLQEYTINTRDAVAGQLYGLQQTRADIQTRHVGGAAPIPFGVAVSRVADSQRDVALGGTAQVSGIALRQINREQNVRPGDGEVAYPVGDSIPVCSDGRVVVEVADATVSDIGKALFVGPDDGVLVVTDRGSDVQTTNVILDVQADANGNLWSVVITNAVAAPVAP